MQEEPRDIRLKRLKMRAEHRGIKEMDLILGGWAAAHLATASDAEVDLFEAILAEADHDLYNWVTGQAVVPTAYESFMAELSKTISGDNA
jgi:antitoxin CptB